MDEDQAKSFIIQTLKDAGYGNTAAKQMVSEITIMLVIAAYDNAIQDQNRKKKHVLLG